MESPNEHGPWACGQCGTDWLTRHGARNCCPPPQLSASLLQWLQEQSR